MNREIVVSRMENVGKTIKGVLIYKHLFIIHPLWDEKLGFNQRGRMDIDRYFQASIQYAISNKIFKLLILK